IYNRWGEKIFSNTVRGWDGTFKGKLVSSGVFVWRLLYKTKFTGNQIHEKKGEVNVII
ncbi:MAG TPA: gliding motility protein, partial [Bacteroidales bacterium]|nr:gliding motility protein [Bacteroidales bacterium]